MIYAQYTRAISIYHRGAIEIKNVNRLGGRFSATMVRAAFPPLHIPNMNHLHKDARHLPIDVQ